MSLRIAPASSYAKSTSNIKSQSKNQQQIQSAPSVPGLTDLLRTPIHHHHEQSLESQTSTHPLETRLTQWYSTQEKLKLNLLRRNFGVAEPLRRGMELKTIRKADSFRPSVLGGYCGGSLHEEILTGKDTELTWEDVYNGQDGVRFNGGIESNNNNSGWSEEMERLVGIDK